MTATSDETVLVVQMDGRTYAIRLQFVREVMRPLPVEAAPGALEFIEGLAIVRGAPTPVLDLAAFIELSRARTRSRWIRVAVRDRALILAVDDVLGVRRISPDTVQALPQLLSGMERSAVDRLMRLDAELVRILGGGLRLPDEVWSTLAGPA